MVWSEENLCPIGVVIWLGSRRTDRNQRQWLGAVVAAVHPSDGGGIDGPCVVAERGVVLPGTAVASGTDGLTQDTRWRIEVWREVRCAQMQASRDQRGVENRFGELMIG